MESSRVASPLGRRVSGNAGHLWGWPARAGEGRVHRRELAQDKPVAGRNDHWPTSISGAAVLRASYPSKLRHQSGIITLGLVPASPLSALTCPTERTFAAVAAPSSEAAMRRLVSSTAD